MAFLLSYDIGVAEAPLSPLESTSAPSGATLVSEYFGDNHIMHEVINCESGFQQFDSNGNPLTSHTRDFGIAQINEATWDDVAQELGLDYKNSAYDNVEMARYIYDVAGIESWVCYDIVTS